jgi:hypothetical protein
MKTSKKKQVSSIPGEPFADVAAIQRALDFFRNYKGVDPTILRAKQKFYRAQEENIFDNIGRIQFTGRFNSDM